MLQKRIITVIIICERLTMDFAMNIPGIKMIYCYNLINSVAFVMRNIARGYPRIKGVRKGARGSTEIILSGGCDAV